MESCISCPFNPLFVWVKLNTSSWPVPTRLRLTDIDFSFNSESHSGVSDQASTSVADDWVKTVESGDSKEVSGLDKGLIELNNSVFWSLLPLVTHGFFVELDVFTDHFRGWLAAPERNVGVEADTTDEEPEGLEEVWDNVDGFIADTEDGDTDKLDVFKFFWSDLEGDLVLALNSVDFDVEVHQGGIEVRVSTEETLWLLEDMDELNSVVIDDVDLSVRLLEALDRVVNGGVLRTHIANIERGKFKVVRSAVVFAVDNSIKDLFSVGFLVLLDVSNVLEEVHSVFFLAEEGSVREIDDGFMAFRSDALVVFGSEFVGFTGESGCLEVLRDMALDGGIGESCCCN